MPNKLWVLYAMTWNSLANSIAEAGSADTLVDDVVTILDKEKKG